MEDVVYSSAMESCELNLNCNTKKTFTVLIDSNARYIFLDVNALMVLMGHDVN